MTLKENSVVEEINAERTLFPETKFNFVPIKELGPYVNGRELVDVIGVVQSVSPTRSIRRKSNNETVPKHDITIADETYDSEGKDTCLSSIGTALTPLAKGGAKSMYSDRVSFAHIICNPSLGDDKPVFFCIKAYISYIKQDQAMWYRACKTCNQKVTEAVGSGYWCEGCQKNEDDCSLRYIMVVKVSDTTSEAYLSVFNEQAEKIIGCSADELNELKTQDGDSSYQMKLKNAMWVPHLFRVSVTPSRVQQREKAEDNCLDRCACRLCS